MFLSRLLLDPRSRRVQRELAAPYEMHRSIMRAFPSVLPAEAERVLFRVDEHAQLDVPVLLVQSLTMPDWSWLGEDAGAQGYLLATDQPNPAIKAFALSLAAGQTLVFRLRANPTMKKTVSAANDKKRIGLERDDEQRAWLDRKAAAGGFRILSAQIAREGTVGSQIHRAGGNAHALTLLAVRFDGLLAVVDADMLRATMARGIGSAKGLGFGLLSVAPPR